MAPNTTPTRTVTVTVAGKPKQYPLDIEGLGNHLATGGKVGSLHGFLASAKECREISWIKSILGWVELDNSGLAYRIEARPSGAYDILGAAPWRDRELRETYTA